MMDESKKTDTLKVIDWITAYPDMAVRLQETGGYIAYDELFDIINNLIDNELDFLIPVFIFGFSMNPYIGRTIEYFGLQVIRESAKDEECLQHFLLRFKMRLCYECNL